jgi:hypothetical protein
MTIKTENRKRKALKPKNEKAKMGAPNKANEEKVLTNHLRPDQWERMEKEASLRNLSAWAFIRSCLDWAITALDTKRGDVEASKLFDGLMEQVDEEGIR